MSDDKLLCVVEGDGGFFSEVSGWLVNSTLLRLDLLVGSVGDKVFFSLSDLRVVPGSCFLTTLYSPGGRNSVGFPAGSVLAKGAYGFSLFALGALSRGQLRGLGG